ncbi:MAG: flavodoxin family protein [Bacteroidales bacterium]|nr:flavodoxin family protein [Bacteroidales bacterium]
MESAEYADKEEGETQRTLMKTIVLNTLDGDAVSEQIGTLIKGDAVEVLNTSDKRIAHCMGCNMCWLKTPGVCAIKDDYEGIIKKLVGAENLWLVSDTRFGFVDWHGKLVMDRIVPMLNMYIEFRDGSERHELRYHPLNFGLLYKGEADQEFLEEWSRRVASNLAGKPLGVIKMGEGEPCM